MLVLIIGTSHPVKPLLLMYVLNKMRKQKFFSKGRVVQQVVQKCEALGEQEMHRVGRLLPVPQVSQKVEEASVFQQPSTRQTV